jgi:hypothetical protein
MRKTQTGFEPFSCVPCRPVPGAPPALSGSLFPAPSLAHAPSVSSIWAGGCDGYAGAASATRGPVVLRPQETRPGLLESPVRAPRDLEGVPWAALRRPRAAICVPAGCFGFPRGSGFARASRISSHPLALPSGRRPLPREGRMHPRPVAGNGTHKMPRRGGSGDKWRCMRSGHMVNQTSFVIPELRVSAISGTQGRSCQRPVCNPGYRLVAPLRPA